MLTDMIRIKSRDLAVREETGCLMKIPARQPVPCHRSVSLMEKSCPPGPPPGHPSSGTDPAVYKYPGPLILTERTPRYRSPQPGPSLPEEREGILMKRFHPCILLCAATVLLLLALPASAVILEVTYEGTVTNVDQKNGTVTINVTHTYGCNFTSPGPVCSWDPVPPVTLTGTVPLPEVLSAVKPGMIVEATSLGGEGGTWIAIGLLRTGVNTTSLYATDLYGEAGSLPVPLVGEYQVSYMALPDCTNCTGTVCTASRVNVSVMQLQKEVGTSVLPPGGNMTYFDEKERNGVYVGFVKGQASAQLCPGKGMMTGPQPVSAFIVHARQGLETGQTGNATPAQATTSVPPKTTAPSPTKSPLPVVLVALALCVSGALFTLRR